MILERIAQIILTALITERLLEGLHRFHWTAELKKHLVGDDDGGGTLTGWKRKFVRCKFCQSWWVAWIVAIEVIWFWDGWSWHWVWIGLVAGSLANKIHDLSERIKWAG